MIAFTSDPRPAKRITADPATLLRHPGEGICSTTEADNVYNLLLPFSHDPRRLFKQAFDSSSILNTT